jgi:amidase
MREDLAILDATAQAELVRTGEISPGELVEAAIQRIERLNPEINAVIHPLFEKARAAAAGPLPDGPFKGVPFLLKDIYGESAGDPYHYGTRFLKDAGWTAPHDSYLTQKFREAGFVFCGRANAPELGAWTTTEPEAYGPSRNPWDTSRSTGGSSGGPAAAVASGMVPAAHANDGGGSIRIPASECGLVGLKPTRGRTSAGPDRGESWRGLVVELAVTRSVRDTAAILDAVQGPMPGDPYFATLPSRPYLAEVGADAGELRIGTMTKSITADVQPDCVAAAANTARLLEDLGHRVEDSHPVALDEEVTTPISTLISSEQAHDMDDWSEKLGRKLGPGDVDSDNWAVAEMGWEVTASQYIATVAFLHAWTRRIASWWVDGFDLLLTPTIPEPPPKLGQLVPDPTAPLAGFMRSGFLTSFTMAFNITGQPAISLPLHWNDDGLPIGVQLVAAYGKEDLLIRVAAQLEQAQPWAERRPPVHAAAPVKV